MFKVRVFGVRVFKGKGVQGVGCLRVRVFEGLGI